METALTTWSNVANISFVRAEDNDPNATLGFYSVDAGSDVHQGAFQTPGSITMGIGYFNRTGFAWNSESLQQGGEAFTVLLHELGHGLGLAHPHDSMGGSQIYPGVSFLLDTGDFGLNQGIYTVMSYVYGLADDDNDLFPGGDFGNEGTPMAFDIAAIQYLYGANMEYQTGDDVYVLSDRNEAGTFYSCIWDAGGVDTISAGSISGDAIIDLRAATLLGPGAGGYLSYVKNVSLIERITGEDADRRIFGGFTIANGAIIENALGGSGNDTVTGNDVNNQLSGQAGNDLVYGLSGNDTLFGNTGNDTLDGGDGQDALFGGIGDDILDAQAGKDTLMGELGKDTLIGGNGADVLVGDQGEDLLFGGAGGDRFVFNTTAEGIDTLSDFFAGEDQIVLSAAGFGGGLVEGTFSTEQFYLGSTATMASHRLIYESSTGELFFDVDGVGGVAQTPLAVLSSGTNLDSNDVFVTT